MVTIKLPEKETYPYGSRSYQNNNPGLLPYDKFSRMMGATGYDDRGNAYFCDYDSGYAALYNFLFVSKMCKLSIEDAIKQYRPFAKQGPIQYAADVAFRSGTSPDFILETLPETNRVRVMAAIQQLEGWILPTVNATVTRTTLSPGQKL